MIILYGHPESGHNRKVAMSLALMGGPRDPLREAKSIGTKPRSACRRYDALGPDLLRRAAMQAWLQRSRALPRRQPTHVLPEKPR